MSEEEENDDSGYWEELASVHNEIWAMCTAYETLSGVDSGLLDRGGQRQLSESLSKCLDIIHAHISDLHSRIDF